MNAQNKMVLRSLVFVSEMVTKRIALLVILLASVGAVAQNDKEQKKLLKESMEYLSDASENLQENNFPIAEADYRKAIDRNPVDETGKYNLGNAYYNKALNAEAMRRFQQAASVATTKPEKHKAFHNLGNTYMNSKQYQEAVEAYKNALRNNPADDETRYNLALAKKMLEEQQKNGGGDDDNKEENKDNKDQEDKENKDDKGKDKESDEGKDKENEDKGDQKDENKEGDNKEDKGKPEEKKDGESEKEKPQQQQPVPGQLSPQQIQNLLEAMNNEEKKVQDKVNATKQKGAKVKSNKDW
ncbi:Tfp pilus assembly protein PilF [Ulvibacter sp. MAR_2010_11]|uniref:tetratricopeptide repeat protein n=1 Tax=Ulvibacter sp. MAR_2010_11 TaxID=1250229 RepID=UPI000CB2C2B6|nr:tetratricopeptide repeat protein [Ulvibacter sp. MAR_2010_11]PKA83043.1 Tfp pilus assembly protein PilF [Ulvibacter sp. MAR_2010_11]